MVPCDMLTLDSLSTNCFHVRYVCIHQTKLLNLSVQWFEFCTMVHTTYGVNVELVFRIILFMAFTIHSFYLNFISSLIGKCGIVMTIAYLLELYFTP